MYCHADWLEVWQSTDEVEYEIDDVEGEIPAALRGGSLYRLGPGRFERGGQRYEHVLDGDGYCLKFAFGASARERTRVAGRFVRTFWHEQEQAAGAVRFRATFGTQPPGGALRNALDLELKNSANTNAQVWGGGCSRCGRRARCTSSTARRPRRSARSPDRMAPPIAGLAGLRGRPRPARRHGRRRGERRAGFGGGAFTAHPHVDPARRRLVGWEWTSLAARKAMRFALREWDERWECAARAEYVMEDCMLAPHDFALTRDYYIFVENRMDMAMAPYVLGAKGPAQTLTMRCDDPVRVHVVAAARARARAAAASSSARRGSAFTCATRRSRPTASA